MTAGPRELLYREAIAEALVQAMEADDRVFVMGIGVDDPKGIFGTTLGAYRRFGGKRVFDTPLAEHAMTGVGVGAALAGMRPVMVHARNDFLLLTMDQLVNNAAKWRYMSGGRLAVPLTIRAIIGRGWGQAAQHSQSLQALFAHVPGLRVVMPSTPHDAKGLLLAAIQDNGPVVVLEHRWLYEHRGPVPEEPFTLPLGRGVIRRAGTDVTVVAVSLMVVEALKAAEVLAGAGIQAEVIDVRSVCPLDDALVFDSVRKTGRLVIADTGWRSFGIGGEIAARVAESALSSLKAPVCRISLPDVPTPCSPALEKVYYPTADHVVAQVKRMMEAGAGGPLRREAGGGPEPPGREFQGPF
jgi:pyruvate dehydrogenase E1 component beta subunit